MLIEVRVAFGCSGPTVDTYQYDVFFLFPCEVDPTDVTLRLVSCLVCCCCDVVGGTAGSQSAAKVPIHTVNPLIKAEVVAKVEEVRWCSLGGHLWRV
jgi:hypothetical protein